MIRNPYHFNEAADRYISFVLKLRENDQSREIGYMEQWKGFFCNKDIREIKRNDVSLAIEEMLKYKKENSRGSGKVAVNRATTRLRHFFSVCVDQWGILTTNPTKGIKKFQESRKKTIFATVAQIIDLLGECEKSKGKDQLLFAMMLLSSGARKSELLRLRYEELDYDDMSAVLSRQKNNKEGKLYFNQDVMKMLKKRNRTQGLIFEHKYLDKGFKLACVRAGVGHLHPHALRHTYASHFAMSGASTIEIQEALRVSSPDLVVRYAHLTPSHVQDKVRTITNQWSYVYD